MTLRATGRLVVVTVALLYLALALGVAISFRDVAAARARMTEQLQPAQDAVAEALVSSADMERSLLAFARDGDRSTLAPFVLGRSYSGRALDRIGAGIADGGLERLRPLYEQAVAERESWLADAAAPLVAAVQSGDAATVDRLTTPAGGPERYAFGKLRTDLRLIQYEVGRLIAADTAVVTAANRRLTWALVVSALAVGALAVGGYALLQRRVLRPLADLGGQLRHLAGENDTATPLAPHGPPEIAAVGRDAERLRQHLVGQIDVAAQANEALVDERPLVAALGSYLQGVPADIQLPGFAAGVAAVTAAGVLSGDWWGVVPASAGRPPLLVLGDASGHDLRAGAVAARFKAALVASLTSGHEPTEALATAVAGFADEPGCFVSCVVLIAAPDGLSYVNAGHCPPLVVRAEAAPAADVAAAQLAPTGPIVSMLGGTWTQATIDLAPGEAVVLFTDGLVEARGAGGLELGWEPIAAWSAQLLHESADDAPAERAQYLAAGVLDRARAAAPELRRDDVTVIALLRT